MNLTVFISVLALLQIVCLWAGKRASRNLNDQQAYFLAGKDVRFFPLLMTFVATQIGGGVILGAPEEAYHFGWTVLFYPLGACLGFVLLAMGVGKKLAQFQVSTVAELVGVVYQSSRLKKITSLLSIVSLLMILVAQVIASRKFMLSIGLDNSMLFLAFWGVVIIYTVWGGLKAVVSIDMIQALYFIAAFVFGFGWILYFNPISLPTVFEGGWSSQNFEFDSHKLIGWLLMPLLFMVIEQDMAQRCFAARSPRIVTQAAACAALCTLFVCIIPVFLGVLGKQAGVVAPEGSSIFMEVVRMFTTPWLSACIGCAVLMAILSTAISLLNAVSSNLTQDFDFAWLKAVFTFSDSSRSAARRSSDALCSSAIAKAITSSQTAPSAPFRLPEILLEKVNTVWLKKITSVQLARIITAGIGLTAVAGSFYAREIVNIVIQSYELSVCCLFIPVFAALFKHKGNSLSAWLAVILGGMGFVLARSVEIDFPKEIFSLILSGVGYGIGEGWQQSRALSRPVEEARLSD